MQKAIFLDKDGTLVTDVPFNVNTSVVRLNKGVLEGLSALQNNGYLLVIISNQPGISLGLFSQNEQGYLIAFMTDLFAKNGINITGFYFCPHKPAATGDAAGSCNCRKPAPGLIMQAAEELDINLDESWMIGDILNDVEAGTRAGCRTILVNNGNETEWEMNIMRMPDYLAGDFKDASDYILSKP